MDDIDRTSSASDAATAAASSAAAAEVSKEDADELVTRMQAVVADFQAALPRIMAAVQAFESGSVGAAAVDGVEAFPQVVGLGDDIAELKLAATAHGHSIGSLVSALCDALRIVDLGIAKPPVPVTDGPIANKA
jgi:hypothetical protein